MNNQEPKSGRDALYQAAAAFLDMQMRDRKSRALRTWVLIGLGVAYLVLSSSVMLLGGNRGGMPRTENYAAVVRVDGPIATGKLASAGLLYETLTKAFQDDRAGCVALAINSPGGMVGQSQMIHDTIKRLAAEHDRKVIAVGEDFMASGGYMVATAADRIYAPTTGLVGSIGVVQQGIDLTGLAEKVGVKDRTYTAGDLKDPFNPLLTPTPEAEAKAREVLGELHQEFIRMVRDARGDRPAFQAAEADPQLYSGAYWTGLRALELGLLDGNLSMAEAIRRDCGADSFVVYEPRMRIFDMLGLIGG